MEASEIAKLAQLARINIEPEMVDEVTESITRILNLVDQLKAADTTDVEPMAHPLDLVQRLRAGMLDGHHRTQLLPSRCGPPGATMWAWKEPEYSHTQSPQKCQSLRSPL